MRTYKILVFTDHRAHSKENSLYALLSHMSHHSACACLHVASRGSERNAAFFSHPHQDDLEVIAVDENFQYDATGKQFSENKLMVRMQDYDIILLRLPRPVSDAFLIQLNNLTKEQIVINHPLGILQTSNKAFLLHYPDLCPPMKLCRNIDEVKEFAKNRDVVLKPLREYGGKGLLKISGQLISDDESEWDLASYLPRIEEELKTSGYLAMKFLKNVVNGDKRIIVVNGDILAASNRLPPAGSWLCNVAKGGSTVRSEPTPEEIHIVQQIDPLLRKNGILIYGVDTLEDDEGMRVLSEINTLSIGGFPHAERQTGRPIIDMTIDRIFEYTKNHHDQ